MRELRIHFSIGYLLFSMIGLAQNLQIDVGAEVIVTGDGGSGPDGTLIVEGDLIMDGDLTCEDDAIIELTGNFQRNNNGFTHAQSTFVFNGTSAQEITRTAGTSNYSETFYNFTLNNPTSLTIVDAEVGLISIQNILNPVDENLNTNDKLLLRALSTNYARVAAGDGDVVGEVTV